jgi:hypothetical protein
VKLKYFFLIPTSKGVTSHDPDLIPNTVGIVRFCFRDRLGINPDLVSGSVRDSPALNVVTGVPFP